MYTPYCSSMLQRVCKSVKFVIRVKKYITKKRIFERYSYEIGANVTLAKNIVAGVKYYDLEQRDGDKDAQTLWSEVVFTF